MGQKFTGKAGIFAPVNLTASQNGVVSISSAPSGDFLITSLIDPSSIRLYSKNNEYSVHHNFDFEFQRSIANRRLAPDIDTIMPMTKWEYVTVPVLIHATKQILDTWGEDGWELAQVVPGPNPQSLVAYLKRPVE